MSKRIRWLTLEKIFPLSPNLTRMDFVGDDLTDFPIGQESGYIKWCFSPELVNTPFSEALAISLGESFTPTPAKLNAANKKPCVRSMTIRAFSEATRNSPARLTIDIVARGKSGPASYWASTAKVGDGISIIGPGATKLAPHDAKRFLFAGDLTALPAIAVNLEQLPSDAQGNVILTVPSSEDCIDLIKPDGIQIDWLVETEMTQIADKFLHKTEALSIEDNELYAWVAGEFETMRQLRRYLRNKYDLNSGNLYASSYWKLGTNDEGNKAAKKRDSEA